MENINRGIIVKHKGTKIEPFNFYYSHIVWIDLEMNNFISPIMSVHKYLHLKMIESCGIKEEKSKY